MADQHKTPNCTNCSYEFFYANNYCPVCGQKNHELRIPLKHLLEEVLETTLHFDSKTIRTIKNLVLKPGFLSVEFNSGKRASYVPPIRLYILISFIFFFLINLLSGGHNHENEAKNLHEKKANFTFTYGAIKSTELVGITDTQVDSIMSARNMTPTYFNKYFVHKMHKIMNSNSSEFSHSLMKNISYMMFVLMPLFGGWIYLFNRKRIKYYIEGLTISVHFHAFVFLVFSILALLSSFYARELFFALGFLIIPFYMLLMFKGVFKQSWLVTIFKTICVGYLYLFSLGGLLILTIIISALLG